MIGMDSGAMIIAPMTVAVESVSTPAVATSADSVSIVQKADRLEAPSPVARSRSPESSSMVLRCESGSTTALSPVGMSGACPSMGKKPCSGTGSPWRGVCGGSRWAGGPWSATDAPSGVGSATQHVPRPGVPLEGQVVGVDQAVLDPREPGRGEPVGR